MELAEELFDRGGVAQVQAEVALVLLDATFMEYADHVETLADERAHQVAADKA